MRWYLLLVLPLICGFQITEIMYDPQGKDNNHEYIEVFTNGSNLSTILFEDLASSDDLLLLQDFATPYALIVEEGYNLTDVNITAYTTGATLGNGLNNDKDLVLFRDNESILDATFYVGSRDGGNNNGKALCVQDHLLIACTPTPGEDNDLNQSGEAINYTLWISEFLPDPLGDDRAARPGGEWVELYNYGEQALDLHGLLLQDARNTTVIISDVHLESPILAAESYVVVYLNGQSILNNEGLETVRLATDTRTIDELTYSRSKEGLTWSKDFEHETLTLSLPTPGAPHNGTAVSLNSSLVLERVYVGNDDMVQFGESFRVRLHVYKGDTEKTTVKVFVANLSKQTTVSIEDKFVEHVFTLTIPLLPNCNGKLADGDYPVYAEGLDATTSLPVTIKGFTKDSCLILQQNTTKEQISLKKNIDAQKPLEHTTTQQPSDSFINGTGRIVYESSDFKARRWAVYFFCFTLLLVIAALVTQD